MVKETQNDHEMITVKESRLYERLAVIESEVKRIADNCPGCKTQVAQSATEIVNLKSELKDIRDDQKLVWNRIWWIVGVGITSLLGIATLTLTHGGKIFK